MKFKLLALFLLSLSLAGVRAADNDKPLRVFIRGGVKTHGPDQHDHPRFLTEWTKLLNDRGAVATGSMEFPTPDQLDKTDVVVIYAADGMKIVGEQRTNFENYLRRGGGLVVIHDGIVSGDEAAWAKKVQGGAWIWANKRTKWLESEVGLYFIDTEHPITRGFSNFDWKDEIYYDLDMAPDVKVLATSFHSVFVIAPQVWTYEKTWEGGQAPYRAFVSIPGHEYTSFQTPHYRALLLRGIAWAGKRDNVDFLCSKEELGSLRYPAGGPTPPDKAAAKLNVHPEFDINLVASEPLIEKVISVDWDPKGRMWVAETPEYPNGRTINRNDAVVAPWAAKEGANPQIEKEDRPAKDRISWLEDTNGDGVMDKKHVFAEGLELVTSLVFYKDGVIVDQAPDILWLRDTDGDGKCNMKDEKVVLYTGFGTGDTHAVLNNLRWGMDGWIYSAIGYSAGNPTSADGSKKFGRVTAGVIRFKPDGSALEQFASGSCNTWGFDFAPDGEPFYTTATCGEHFLHIVMPEKILARGNVGGIRASKVIPDHQKIFPAVHHTRPAYIQIDLVGQFTAAAGSCIYNGGAWPDRFNGSHFCSEATMSMVHNEFLRPDGVSYIASKEKGREETEFIAGTDLWFRPIHERVGPDGALYVVDFYNQAAIHNDTRGPKHGAHNAAVRPDRDHHFARIWRVQHKEAKKLDQPQLDAKNPAQLVKALEHPNGFYRMTAERLLIENDKQPLVSDVVALVESDKPAYGRINALWALNNWNALQPNVLAKALNDPEPAVRKNALRAFREEQDSSGSTRAAAENKNAEAVYNSIVKLVSDSDPRVRLEALIALGSYPYRESTRDLLVSIYPDLNDRWLESAVLGTAAQSPLEYLMGALESKDSSRLEDFARRLTGNLATRQDAALAASLITKIAPGKASSLKKEMLQSLALNLKTDVRPAWSPELQSAFKQLIALNDDGITGAALPLIVRWDANGAMSSDLKPTIERLKGQLHDKNLSDEQRTQIAINLLGARTIEPSAVAEVSQLLEPSSSISLQRHAIQALGNTPDAAVGVQLVAAYPKLAPELLDTAFGQIIKRSDWSMALLDAIKAQKISLGSLGPASIHRLRTHSDKGVGSRAVAIIEEIRGPQVKEKDTIIAKFLSTVEQTGNIETGKKVFTENCAVCHKFKGQGRDLAPDLTGMGAHGAHELLVHILDPNRVVEPNFVSTSIETKDDQSLDGVVARENSATLTIRNATGDYEIRQDNISKRRSTGLSLMPEGFESLGAENLRDLIAFISADENRFRILDLSPAYTANSLRGIYTSQDNANDTLRFSKFGLTKVDSVPFDVVHPTRTTSGNNLIVLKGGNGFAKTLPQRVEFKAGVKASKLYFLGGVGGWAWPCCGENKNEGAPVAKVTLYYADGKTEELLFKNGVEFADFNGRAEVPGSKEVPELVRYGQVRWFSKPVGRSERIDKIAIESFDNIVAPTFVAITAEVSAGTQAAKSN